MKIKVPNIDFVAFNDGVCSIYSEDEEEQKVFKYENLSFSNKVLGLNRYYAAKTAQVQINAVISIPYIENIDSHDIVIMNSYEYSIELIQLKNDTNPRSIDLTLRKLEMHGGM